MVPWVARALLLLPLALVACGAEGTDGSDEELGEDLAPLVKPDVRVVDAELREDEIVLSLALHPELASIKTDDVIVSARGAGLLRRVTARRIEGDSLMLTTGPASLEDVFEQASVRGRVEPKGDKAVAVAIPDLEIKDRRIALGNGSEIELAHGYFSFKPKLDFDLAMKRGKVQRLNVVASGESHAKIDVRYHLVKSELENGGPFRRDDAEGIPLVEAPPVFATFWVGYVPVVVSVRARLLASWGLGVGGKVDGQQDVAIDGAATAGIDYRDGNWKSIASKNLAISRTGDSTLVSYALNGELRVTARLDVRFYEMAGPFVGLQAYTGVIRETTLGDAQWFTHRGLRGIAGAQIAPFGKKFIGYEAVLFDVNDRTPMR